MIALFVIGGILLFLLLLLLMPVSLRFAYRGGVMRLSVHYLLIKLDFSPEQLAARSEASAKKREKKQEKTQREEADAEPDKTKEPGDTVRIVRSLAKAGGKALDRLRRGIVIYKVRVRIVVSKEEARLTALAYARLTAALSILRNILDELFALKDSSIQIMPDFTGEKSTCDIALRVRILPITFVRAAAAFGLAFLKMLREEKSSHVKKKRKGGQLHESAASHQ